MLPMTGLTHLSISYKITVFLTSFPSRVFTNMSLLCYIPFQILSEQRVMTKKPFGTHVNKCQQGSSYETSGLFGGYYSVYLKYIYIYIYMHTCMYIYIYICFIYII